MEGDKYSHTHISNIKDGCCTYTHKIWTSQKIFGFLCCDIIVEKNKNKFLVYQDNLLFMLDQLKVYKYITERWVFMYRTYADAQHEISS